MLILCGTDFSVAADEAALVAAKLASALRANLLVVTVIPEAASEDPIARALAADADDLVAAAPNVADLATAVLRGADVAGTIASHAQHERADLIVVAAHGTAAAKGRVGRVAERVVAESTEPVLVVQDAAAMVRWLDREEHLRVLFSASLKPSEDAALDFVARFRAIAPCDVTALHMAFPPTADADVDPRGGRAALLTPDADAHVDAKEALLQELKRRVGQLGGAGEVSFAVDDTFARVDDRILEAANERRASLIVLGSHHRDGAARFFHASVAASVLRHTTANVVVAPDSAARDLVPRIRRVLVPIDRIDGGAYAVSVACGLVAAGGDVDLVHVVDDADAQNATQRRDPDAFARAMKALVPRDAEAAGIRVTASTLEAPLVAHAICATALASGADAICMRSRARRRGAALLGSVLDDVLRKSARPVVVVRDEE